MRTSLRIGLALLAALALSTPVSAEIADRVSFNAYVGPSFGNFGTTVATRGALDFNLGDRVTLGAELGMMPHAPFSDADEIAPPAIGFDPRRVNAFHWNGNLTVRPFDIGRASPYVTAGLGCFSTDAVTSSRVVDGISVRDVRRATDLATNVGAGLLYRVTDWVGINADYRTFFVHRDQDDPKVHRFTTGVSFFLN